jgi:hypothetical protein
MNLAASRPGGHRHSDVPIEHAHFGDRRVSRREFVVTATGTLAAVLGAGLGMPQPAYGIEMGGSAPKPIPGGFKPPFTERFIHHYVPPMVESGRDPSQIIDFSGIVGVAQIAGAGTGTDKRTGAASQLLFEIDNRFMKGTYAGLDGRQYSGTFGFL